MNAVGSVIVRPEAEAPWTRASIGPRPNLHHRSELGGFDEFYPYAAVLPIANVGDAVTLFAEPEHQWVNPQHIEDWRCAHEDDKDPGHTTLYVIHSMTSQDVLYVGITGNVKRRFKQHRAKKPWWRDSENASLECYSNWESACEAERSRIDTYRPIHNVVGNAHRQAPSIPCEVCGYPIPVIELDYNEERETQHEQCNTAICDAYMAGVASTYPKDDPIRSEIRVTLDPNHKEWI